MIKLFKSIFADKKEEPKKYKGFSDFLMNAPAEEQKEVFAEAARKANEDQMEVYKASLKGN